ncbi:Na+:solute symporter [candidate division KSB1 bacterium]|nr:Na+:solute symporter [candidate division KSB1 bacterium]
MNLHAIDVGIILAYLVIVIGIGFWISRKAGSSIDSYFLGNNTMPWYVLGISNASSMFDITGTMWLVYVIFVYGLKGVLLPWLWPTFNQIFLMIFLSVWIRRSNVMTGGEWITSRFGSERGAELSRIIVVIFALVSVIGFLTYDFAGIGKFAWEFLPHEVPDSIRNVPVLGSILPETFSANFYAVVFMGITTIYVIAGGMYSVVLTDVIQFIMLAVASIAIGYIAFTHVTPEILQTVVPEGWNQLLFGWKLNLDWSNLIPAVNDKITADGYSFFSIIMMMILFKGILISMAGPAPNYDMQRILATRNAKESALMSSVVSVALFPRWIMITGITVLALIFYSPELKAMGPAIDFEMILPYVINRFVPVGLTGVMIAGLLAAFMSTFDSTVNAGAAYLVNDIYKRYLKPTASDKHYVLISYMASFIVVIVGIIFGFFVKSIDQVMQWIVSGLWGGYTAPNILKWYWWRFNGYGYFYGMLTGIACALILPILLPGVSALNTFPLILLISGIACIVASLATAPEEENVLKNFYSRVRPWGFWKPIYELVIKENPSFNRNKSFKRDMFNVLTGIVWQLTLVLIPVYFVIKDYKSMWISALVMIIATFILKYNWYNKLEKD